MSSNYYPAGLLNSLRSFQAFIVNVEEFKNDLVNNFYNQWITNCSLTVDTFFVIGAALTSFTWFGRIRSGQSCLRCVSFSPTHLLNIAYCLVSILIVSKLLCSWSARLSALIRISVTTRCCYLCHPSFLDSLFTQFLVFEIFQRGGTFQLELLEETNLVFVHL